jgi:dihydropteroate synthase
MVRIEPSLGITRGFFDLSADIDGGSRLYLRPVGFLFGEVAAAAVVQGHAARLAGGEISFTAIELFARTKAGIASTVATVPETLVWSRSQGVDTERLVASLLEKITAPRAAYAGLSLDCPRVMGVINATPDSFSDGGEFANPEAAVARGMRLVAEGADILDIGGESTRPGAVPVSEDEELRRVIPVIEGLGESGAVLSVDSYRAGVMSGALAMGALVLNDITALTGNVGGDAGSLDVAADPKHNPFLVLMHMQGEPASMQDAPSYAFAPLDIYDYLEERIAACVARGIPLSRIAVDPGIGFGKSVAHNMEILSHLSLFHGLGCALVIGVSRKGFIGEIGGALAPSARIPGTIACNLAALDQGVRILRVHDVAETVQAVALWKALHSLS